MPAIQETTAGLLLSDAAVVVPNQDTIVWVTTPPSATIHQLTWSYKLLVVLGVTTPEAPLRSLLPPVSYRQSL